MAISNSIQGLRQTQVSKTTGIIAVLVVIAAILLVAYFIYGSSTPSAAQIQATQTETAKKFTEWAKAHQPTKKPIPLRPAGK